jgi:N6-L-threonylcarbamoyladenine synthase
MQILGIETSCDETAVGVVEDGRRIASNVVASSLAQHAPYGGVIPEIAARAHVETIWGVLHQALAEAAMGPDDIDAVAVTQGPGLPGALLIGLAFAKGLALTLERPLIPVNHLAAHLYAGEMTEPTLAPPYVGLVISGGHTLLCVAHPDYRYELLGDTKDDAVGEAFDKVAKLLGLGYPGGPAIDRLSDDAPSPTIAFPRSRSKRPFDFSFSGLKTAVVQHVQAHEPKDARQVADVAASFQEAAVDTLLTKTLRACQRTGVRRLVLGGGVASNRRLRARFAEAAGEQCLQLVIPPPALCVDNGAMVAGMAFPLLERGRIAALSLASDPNLPLAGGGPPLPPSGASPPFSGGVTLA